MDARRRSRSGNRLAGRRRERRRRRRDRSGLARNDQLLAGRQRARALVAIGLQDRGGRNIVALRQDVERVAGADDDRGAALRRRTGGRDRARRRRCRWFRSADGRRRVGRKPAPSSGHAAGAGRIGVRRSDRGGGKAWDWYCGGWRLRPRILRQLAALDGGRAAPNRWLRAARQRDWKRSCRKGASAYRRCSRQSRPTSAPAPRPAAPDASKATRRHGTWLLTRTQQNTVLSKHVPSKQPLNPRNKTLAGTANPGFYSSRAIPGSAGTKRTSTSSLRSKPLSVLADPDQGLGAVMRADRRDQDAAGLEPLPAACPGFAPSPR